MEGQEPTTGQDPTKVQELEVKPGGGQEPTAPADDPNAPVDLNSLPANVRNMVKQLREENAQSRREKQAAAKAAEDAATKADAEQGRYKELWEKAQADTAKAAAEAQAARQEALRLRVVGSVPGFPAAWADRLRGETLEEMAEDAKQLMAALPKPAAPNANGVPGDGSKPLPGQLNDVEKAELAAIYNVNPKYMT